MTPSSFGSKGHSGSDRPGTPGDIGAASAGNRRTWLIAAGTAAAVAVAATVAVLAWPSGGAEEEEFALPPMTPRPTASATVDGSPSPSATGTVKPKNGRDPFKAVVVAAPSATAAPAPTGPAIGAPTPLPPVPTSGTAPGTPAPQPSSTDAPRRVQLGLVAVAADNKSAEVLFDGQPYKITLGKIFANAFLAMSFVNGDCGSFTTGELMFDLCEGEFKDFYFTG